MTTRSELRNDGIDNHPTRRAIFANEARVVWLAMVRAASSLAWRNECARYGAANLEAFIARHPLGRLNYTTPDRTLQKVHP